MSRVLPQVIGNCGRRNKEKVSDFTLRHSVAQTLAHDRLRGIRQVPPSVLNNARSFLKVCIILMVSRAARLKLFHILNSFLPGRVGNSIDFKEKQCKNF
jgi:hypothetical protein